jgi:hypothetical protein
MPKLIVRKGDWPDTTGATMEIVELDTKAADPHLMEGHGPGGWMYQDIASLDEDISHASTISPLRLGENPNNVQTYGQLALLNDNEQVKRERMIQGQRAAVATIVKLGLYDIERYWPDEKQATVEGEDGRLERAVFRKSDIPKDVRVKPADGSPLPRTQGAQIKKVDAIFQAAVESGAAARDPDSWTAWYKASYDAGEPQDLPTRSPSTQQQLAQLENMLMRQGEEVEPAYYDDLHLHLPVHRLPRPPPLTERKQLLMGLTVAFDARPDGFTFEGARQVRRGTLTFDSSYATGGESITKQMLQLHSVDRLTVQPPAAWCSSGTRPPAR